MYIEDNKKEWIEIIIGILCVIALVVILKLILI